MKRAIAVLVALAFAHSAHAARFTVFVTTPSTNEPVPPAAVGSPLTDLAGVIVAWGTCNPDNTIAKQDGAVRVNVTMINMKVPVSFTTSGPLASVCSVAYAIDAAGAMSVPTNPLPLVPLPALGKPVTLGQPIQLPPK